MRHRDFATLYDQSSGLTCHQVPVNDATENLVTEVRDMFILSMSNFGYAGFSREIDDRFHWVSTYVYVTEGEKVVMTCRVTARRPASIIPLEMGVRENGESYSLSGEERLVDINTYTYIRGYYQHAMPLLAAGLGYYSKECGARNAYCLYDVANEKIKRAYLSIGFALSDRFPEPIYFPTYCRETDGHLEPVRWRIMEWDHETIETYARLAIEVYQIVDKT
jgi:hypothetical protein